jgi:hypothetical protein
MDGLRRRVRDVCMAMIEPADRRPTKGAVSLVSNDVRRNRGTKRTKQYPPRSASCGLGVCGRQRFTAKSLLKGLQHVSETQNIYFGWN